MKLIKNRVCELLGIEFPIIQAPMHRITGAELAGAISEAGGLGVIGPIPGVKDMTTEVENGEHLRLQIKKTKSLTNKPFGVNLVVLPVDEAYSDKCARVVIEECVPVVVLAGGSPEKYVKILKDAHIKVLYRPMPVNNTESAKKAEQLDIDAFIAVGLDGGGYVGDDRIPTFAQIPQFADALKIPVIAGGGIVDGRGMIAAMALGADGIYMGTRFIASNECLAHISYKQAIVDATDVSTVVVSGLHGGLVRTLRSTMVENYVQLEEKGLASEEDRERFHGKGSLPWLAGDWKDGPFPSGAGAGLIREIKSGAEIVKSIMSEAQQILDGK